MRRSALRWAAAALPLLTACAAGPAPLDHFYRLTVPTPEVATPEVAAPEPRSTPLLSGTVEVEPFEGTPLTRERRLLRSDGVEVVPARFHLWEDSPTLAVQQELIRWLEASALADDAVAPELRAPHAWRIQGRLTRFERVPDGVLVELELSLLRSADGRLVVSRTYRVEEPAGGAPRDAARAFGQALDTAFDRFAADVASALG